jgi:protease I
LTTKTPLHAKRFLILVGDAYEDLELWYPKLRLMEAGAEIVVAGPEAGSLPARTVTHASPMPRSPK